MNILLTGGTGYIGSHAAVEFVNSGHNVILYDNLSNSKIEVVDNLEKILGFKPHFIEGDIRDTEKLFNTLKDYSVDAVIHFAGLKAVGESTQKPLEYFDNNVSGTISLLDAMKRAEVKTIVFSSSATVYGEPQYLPLDENHPTAATNPYGRTKLHIEEILNDLSRADKSWRIVCLRYFNPVGAHESGLIGEDPNGIPNNLMPYIAQVSVGKLSHLNVWGNDYETRDGTGVRDYIHVVDLAGGHVKALDYATKNAGWIAINLGTGRGYSVLEMVWAYERACGKKIPFQIKERRPGDISICYAKTDRSKDLLDWETKLDIVDMCKSTWKWQSK